MSENNIIVIDLSGPHGNAFFLLSLAQKLLQQTNAKDSEIIMQDMESHDYEHLLNIFEKNFGEYVILMNRRSTYRH